jgi:hypothetical protein
MRGWEDFARDLEARRAELGFGWIAAENYTLEGQLARRLGWGRVIPLDEKERWLHLPPTAATVASGPGLLVTRANRDSSAGLAHRFEDVTPVGAITRAVGDRPIETYNLYRIARPIAP